MLFAGMGCEEMKYHLELIVEQCVAERGKAEIQGDTDKKTCVSMCLLVTL